MIKYQNFAYGASSAIMTGLAIIIGLSTTINAVFNIVTALLIIAVADNFSDAFGIHLQEESQQVSPKEVTMTTTYNFLARLITTTILILFIILLPMTIAIILSVIYGLIIMILLSYHIAKVQKVNPYKSAFRHVMLAIAIMVASFIFRELITKYASKIVV